MAMSRPGISPAGTLESAAGLTVVEAQTRKTPRWGRITSVVWLPEVMAPLAAMMALPEGTSRAPVTVAAWPGFLLSSGTMAIGPDSTAGAGEGAGAWDQRTGAAASARSEEHT